MKEIVKIRDIKPRIKEIKKGEVEKPNETRSELIKDIEKAESSLVKELSSSFKAPEILGEKVNFRENQQPVKQAEPEANENSPRVIYRNTEEFYASRTYTAPRLETENASVDINRNGLQNQPMHNRNVLRNDGLDRNDLKKEQE